MSRYDNNGWDEDYPNQWALQTKAQELAIAGRRGKALLRELEADLLALPRKRLIEGSICKAGDVCAVGALALGCLVRSGTHPEEALRLLEEKAIDTAWRTAELAHDELGASRAWAFAVSYENDSDEGALTPEQRYVRVLAWVQAELAKPELHRPPPRPQRKPTPRAVQPADPPTIPMWTSL